MTVIVMLSLFHNHCAMNKENGEIGIPEEILSKSTIFWDTTKCIPLKVQ
jgi:hypothetical protein